MTFLAGLLISAMASGAEVHWERLPDPGGEVVDLVGRDDGAILLMKGGRLLEGGPDGWTELAPPTGHAMKGVALDGDRLWVWQGDPAVVRAFENGAWSASEAYPLPYITHVAPLGDGRVVAGGPGGHSAIRDVDGVWSRLEISLGSMTPVADGRGGAWWITENGGGGVFHLDAKGAVTGPWTGPAIWSRSTEPGAVLPDGSLLVAPESLRKYAGSEPEVLAEGHRRGVVTSGDVVWSWDTEMYRGDERVPAPGVPVQAAAGSDGTLWISTPDGLFRSVDGPGLALRNATAVTGVGGALPRSQVVAGDFDGDGLDDLFLYDYRSGETSVWRQRDAHFVPWFELDFPVGRAVVGDVDGNGIEDLVVASMAIESGQSEIVLLRGLPGRLVVESGAVTGAQTRMVGQLALGDLDGDGDLDLTMAGGGRDDTEARVAAWENTGLGRFERQPVAPTGLGRSHRYVGKVMPGDLDADGLPDAVAINMWGDLEVLHGTSEGFVPVRPSGLEGQFGTPRNAWLADFEGDGSLDLLTACPDPPFVALGRNGRFEAQTGAAGIAGWPGLVGAAVGDLDGDGRADLVGCDTEACRVAVGSADGLVDVSASMPVAQGALALALPDLGGDGDLDVLLIGERTTLLENQADPGARAVPAVGLQVRRKLVWAKPVDALVAGLILLGWLVAAGVARRSDGPVLGRTGVAVLAAVATLPGWLWVADRAVWVRLGFGAGVAVLAVAIGGIEAAWAERRRAQWIAGFRLLELLGAGGMGTVWRARSPDGDDVALKIVKPDLLQTENDRRLYREEARMGAEIDHPGVVRILGFGEWNVVDGDEERPTAYLVMERIDGRTLGEVLKARGPLPVGEACALVHQVCEALDAIHKLGVVHRDVKPSNVMIERGESPRAVLMDFGAARYVGQVTQRSRDVIGTVGYLAPEQGMGEPPDPRADLYAAGVVLYELLAGHRPFEADNLVTLMGLVLEGEPAPLDRPDVSDALQEVLDRALARHKEERFASAQQMAAALEPFCTGIRPLVAAKSTSGADTVTATRPASDSA